jgi:hypothetical protein
MAPFLSNRLHLRIDCLQPPFTITARLGLSCILLAALRGAVRAQTYKQGLPTVGNSAIPSTAAPSQMFIDATQFSSAGDMCAAVAAACAKLGTAGYPFGAAIDTNWLGFPRGTNEAAS